MRALDRYEVFPTLVIKVVVSSVLLGTTASQGVAGVKRRARMPKVRALKARSEKRWSTGDRVAIAVILMGLVALAWSGVVVAGS
jgi:hypothetical protein